MLYLVLVYCLFVCVRPDCPAANTHTQSALDWLLVLADGPLLLCVCLCLGKCYSTIRMLILLCMSDNRFRRQQQCDSPINLHIFSLAFWSVGLVFVLLSFWRCVLCLSFFVFVCLFVYFCVICVLIYCPESVVLVMMMMSDFAQGFLGFSFNRITRSLASL